MNLTKQQEDTERLEKMLKSQQEYERYWKQKRKQKAESLKTAMLNEKLNKLSDEVNKDPVDDFFYMTQGI